MGEGEREGDVGRAVRGGEAIMEKRGGAPRVDMGGSGDMAWRITTRNTEQERADRESGLEIITS